MIKRISYSNYTWLIKSNEALIGISVNKQFDALEISIKQIDLQENEQLNLANTSEPTELRKLEHKAIERLDEEYIL